MFTNIRYCSQRCLTAEEQVPHIHHMQSMPPERAWIEICFLSCGENARVPNRMRD